MLLFTLYYGDGGFVSLDRFTLFGTWDTCGVGEDEIDLLS
jgi:hypothetical protein